MRTVCAVSLEPAPEMTGTSTTSLTARTSSTFSSMCVVGDSPVVPLTTKPAPEMTGTSTTSLTARTSSTFSSMCVVGDSPVVPLTTMPSAPSATSGRAIVCAAS